MHVSLCAGTHVLILHHVCPDPMLRMSLRSDVCVLITFMHLSLRISVCVLVIHTGMSSRLSLCVLMLDWRMSSRLNASFLIYAVHVSLQTSPYVLI